MGEKQSKIRVLVGEEFPDDLDVSTEEPPCLKDSRNIAIVVLALLVGLLVLGLAAYAMATSNQELLNEVVTLAKYGFWALCVIAGGKTLKDIFRDKL